MTILSSVMGTVREWFGKHLYFSKATMCIQGLVFSHSLVDHAIMSILIMHLNNGIWMKPHFQISAVIINVREGLSSIMVLVLAHLPHTYKGYFKIIVTTNAAYVVGLGILWSSTVDINHIMIAARVFYGVVVLLTLGEAGRSGALNEFLDEQYLSEQDQTECIDDKKLQDRQKALRSLPWFLGAVVVIAFSVKETVWEQIIKISTVVIGVFHLFFWFGYSYYFIKSPRVIEAEPVYPIEEAERDETCIDTEENHIEHVEGICKDTEENNIEQVQSLEICIDIEELAAEPVRRGKFWGVIKKMKDRKHFRNEILAIWLTFLVYSVVRAAGSTFFFEQMDTFPAIKPIAILFHVLDSLSKYITSHLWESLPKKWKSNTRVRIGCGMVSTVLCCAVAWQVEIRRLNHEVKKQGAVREGNSKAISMSIFWLVPQFSLLGIMEGLAEDGLTDFFVDRVAGDDDKAVVRYYASHTTNFVIGVGKLLTALSILAFRRGWFNDSINMSHLDKYYRALTFKSVVGFSFFVCVSTCYCTSAREGNETNSDRICQDSEH